MSNQTAIEELREMFPKGSTVYLTILRHCSSSGMLRVVTPVQVECRDGKPSVCWPTWLVASVLGWKVDTKREGIRVSGCGMDMGFHLVYELASVLHGDGYALSHRWM